MFRYIIKAMYLEKAKTTYKLEREEHSIITITSMCHNSWDNTANIALTYCLTYSINVQTSNLLLVHHNVCNVLI